MNNITIELCAEDRARLDSLIVLAARLANSKDTAPAEVKAEEAAMKPTPAEVKAEEPAEASAPVEDTAPWEAPEPTPEPVKQAKPSVTLEQIQQKVVQLCAAFGGKKKAQVREVIGAYGAKVSDLKDQPEKWDEVWDRLAAIEIAEV